MSKALLTDNSPAPTTEPTVVNINIPNLEKLSKTTPARQTGVLGPNMVALYVSDSQEPLLVEITNQAILGRYIPNSTTQPRIDLTPYDALNKGISRMHAVIRRSESELIVQDLSSSNGTWLNGYRLEPYTPVPLKSGDRLLLGHISIEVRFQQA